MDKKELNPKMAANLYADKYINYQYFKSESLLRIKRNWFANVPVVGT